MFFLLLIVKDVLLYNAFALIQTLIMRKFFSFCVFLLYITNCFATLSSNGVKYSGLKDIDYVFMFNGINNSSFISYDSLPQPSTINWYKTNDLTNSISNLDSFSPEDSTAYTLKVDNKIVAQFWVIDYKLHQVQLQNFEPSLKGDQCKSLNILINDSTGGIPRLSYMSRDLSVSHELVRNYTLSYKTKSWQTDTWSDKDTVINLSISNLDKYITINNPPLCNTVFTIKGDQYSKDLGLSDFSYNSKEYIAKAVKTKLTSVLALRNEKNEMERPEKTDPNQKIISGSTPLDVAFNSNANEPVAQNYRWDFSQNNNLIASRLDKDQRYTFNEMGTYKVVLTVSNESCSCKDSISVTTSESYLFIPRIFTTNGDGIQDEFRVGYKSLSTFECWVYNRWGKLVYYWNDPQRGWDGNINGQKASSGPYYYVIHAIGNDKKVYKKAGDINIYRGKDE